MFTLVRAIIYVKMQNNLSQLSPQLRSFSAMEGYFNMVSEQLRFDFLSDAYLIAFF